MTVATSDKHSNGRRTAVESQLNRSCNHRLSQIDNATRRYFKVERSNVKVASCLVSVVTSPYYNLLADGSINGKRYEFGSHSSLQDADGMNSNRCTSAHSVHGADCYWCRPIRRLGTIAQSVVTKLPPLRLCTECRHVAPLCGQH